MRFGALRVIGRFCLVGTGLRRSKWVRSAHSTRGIGFVSPGCRGVPCRGGGRSNPRVAADPGPRAIATGREGDSGPGAPVGHGSVRPGAPRCAPEDRVISVSRKGVASIGLGSFRKIGRGGWVRFARRSGRSNRTPNPGHAGPRGGGLPASSRLSRSGASGAGAAPGRGRRRGGRRERDAIGAGPSPRSSWKGGPAVTRNGKGGDRAASIRIAGRGGSGYDPASSAWMA